MAINPRDLRLFSLGPCANALWTSAGLCILMGYVAGAANPKVGCPATGPTPGNLHVVLASVIIVP
jgi:hypothetical protein